MYVTVVLSGLANFKLSNEQLNLHSRRAQCTILPSPPHPDAVAFRIYDIDCDGFISNGELFQVWNFMHSSQL